MYYRICKKREEDWTHILRECEDTREDVGIKGLMDGDGKGYEIMKKIEKKERRGERWKRKQRERWGRRRK